MASYRNRALDLSAHVKHPEQLVDAIAIILSVANDARHLEWADAVVILKQASLKRVMQTALLNIQIETENGVTYQTVEPTTDAALKVLTRSGKIKPKQPGGDKPSDLIYSSR
jgi:hypothetical protein